MTEPVLFEMEQEPLPGPPPRLSADRRRTERQRTIAATGRNPLTLVFGERAVPRHPDAPRTTGPDDGAPGPRCGECRFRELYRYHHRSWPKCSARDGARLTHSAASDVRAWWPACGDFELADPQPTSPDAARWTPDLDGP